MGELLFIDELMPGDPSTRSFQGYYRNEDATNKKLAYNVLTRGDQYLRTGDIVKVSYDGFKTLTTFEDRIGDTFRWKGENVSTMVSPQSLF